jgi:hypothetical protein
MNVPVVEIRPVIDMGEDGPVTRIIRVVRPPRRGPLEDLVINMVIDIDNRLHEFDPRIHE